MTYYIIYSNTDINDLDDTNILGDVDTKDTFWKGTGFTYLQHFIDKNKAHNCNVLIRNKLSTHSNFVHFILILSLEFL